MKNKVKGIILIILILGVVILMPGFMENTIRAADEAEWSQEGTDDFYGFTIVEIVPYKGMGELGYLVGGEEPVNGNLMTWEVAQGAFSFLGDAVKAYPSYIESPIPANGQPASGWRAPKTYELQNGYYERVSNDPWYSASGLFTLTGTQSIYEYVADGTGAYAAKLPDNFDLGNLYDTWNPPLNAKNVKAYFRYGMPGDTSQLFSTSRRYRAYSVTESKDGAGNHNGNYDYDVATRTFVLNKGHGAYNVLFVSDNNGSYYMLKDYEIVEDFSGDYSCENITYRPKAAGEAGNYNLTVSDAPGFTYESYTYNYKYRWVQSDTALTKPNYSQEGSGTSHRIWVRGRKVVKTTYQFRYMAQIVNHEWFKTMSLGIPVEQVREYPVRVITITPAELNNPQNYHIIDEANLFYINSKYDTGHKHIELYENYSEEGRALPSDKRFYNNPSRQQELLNFAVNDTNWTVTDKLFRKIAGIGCNKAAAIIRSTYFQEAVNGSGKYGAYSINNISYGHPANYSTRCTSVNLAKLYIMLIQRNMVDFYNSFMNPATTGANNRIHEVSNVNTNTVNSTGSTGSFVRPGSSYADNSNAALYWNTNTFLPMGLNADGVMTYYSSYAEMEAAGITNHNMLKDTLDLHYNILILHGSDFMSGKFDDPIGLPSDVSGDAKDHMNTVNPDGNAGNSFTIGDLGNVITNNGTGYENKGGVAYPDGNYVEGPPESNGPGSDPEEIPDDGTEGSNQRTYKRVLNIQPTAYFTKSEENIRAMLAGFDVQIIHMTSTQFNGSIEDLNSKYDVIYMGSSIYDKSYNRFNLNSTEAWNNFTDDNLDRHIYTIQGDKMLLSNPSNTFRYQSNDITNQKRNELKAFLAAGYPIVLEANLYNISNASNSTAKVDPNTNIYKFVNESKSNTRLMNYGDYVSNAVQFRYKIRNYMNTIRPVINLTEPVIAAGASRNYITIDPATDKLTIRFQLLPKNGIPSLFLYDAYLYLDKNGDGIFEASENLDARSSDGSRLENLLESRSRIYTCIVNMSALNGVYQWKLLLERKTNTNVRSVVTGYASVANGKELNILQITDDSTKVYSLDEMILNSNKLITDYAGPGKLTDYSLNFDTLNIDEFEAKYAEAPYNPSNPTATNKLANYHVVIFDNPTASITNTSAVQNIKDEISLRNLGVIFTKNARGYTAQSELYKTAENSFLNEFTYNYMNRYSISKTMYIYRNMKGNNDSADLDRDNTYQTSYLTKSNEGTVTQYPYKINKAIKTVDNSYSGYAAIDFDLTKTVPEKLIGWYCLSDKRDPLVREEFTLGASNELYQGVYSSSPNDVKNNYYLFSNGTCHYTGIRLADADVSGNADEMKLFVNTILACHKSAWNRVVSSPPEIVITRPVPQPQGDGTQKIMIQESDMIGTDFILRFKVQKSSSNMDLTVTLNKAGDPVITPVNYIYPVVAGNLGSGIAINNTDKVVQRDVEYALKLPMDQLAGTNKLTLTAENNVGNRDTEEVFLEFSQPPVLTLLKPEPVAHAAAQYIYADLDYSIDAEDEEYLSGEPPLSIEFMVEAYSAYSLSYTSGTDNLLDGGPDDVEEILLIPDDPANGPIIQETYQLNIPAYFIKDKNIREMKITVTDSFGLQDEITIIIARRSLFPLD